VDEDTDETCVPDNASQELIGDLDALERSCNDLLRVFGDKQEAETVPSPAMMLAVVFAAAWLTVDSHGEPFSTKVPYSRRSSVFAAPAGATCDEKSGPSLLARGS
jgi:hypothetical protein